MHRLYQIFKLVTIADPAIQASTVSTHCLQLSLNLAISNLFIGLIARK